MIELSHASLTDKQKIWEIMESCWQHSATETPLPMDIYFLETFNLLKEEEEEEEEEEGITLYSMRLYQ